MECNKDEALRAKQIAESRMQSGDFVGALKFAMKARNLFPDTQNIAQVITVCEVHSAAQHKLHGSEMDWYGILQADRSADEATVKKQYRKLALMLHPDKNKCAGAEAAFKLIGEANRVLGDQSKRSRYDMIRGVSAGAAEPKPPSHHSNSSSFGTKYDGTARNFRNSFYPHSNSSNSHPRDDETFWTSCEHCNTRYKYYKAIINATLRCQHCSKTFKAHDLGFQGVASGYTQTSFNNYKEASKHMPPKPASEENGGKPFGRGQEDKFGKSNPVSMTKCTAGVGSNDGCVAAGGSKPAAGTSKPAASKAKESEASANVGCKRARQSASDSRDDNMARNGNAMKNTNAKENVADHSGRAAGVHPRRSSREKQQVSYSETSQYGDLQSPPKRQRQYGSFNTTKLEKREGPSAVGGQSGEIRKDASGPAEEAPLRNKTRVEQSRLQRKKESKSDNSPSQTEIVCPDPDFNDFDKEKAEDCFAAGQFWAIYDDSHSMPRFYALVKKVFSPFKLQIIWLEADPDEQGEIDWSEAGLPVGCGKFTVGKTLRTNNIGMFSHRMHCVKESGRGCYLVYPTKGETWAIFRDWDIGWSSNPEKHSKPQFEYVEVLTDFDENVGIKVAYLGKVNGFVSLFQKTLQNGVCSFRVPCNELYKFSHRVPSFKMTGDEREGVPRGSFELDPAGLPSNFFEVCHHGGVKMEDGMSKGGVNNLRHESSKCKVEQAMTNESIRKAMLNDSNDVERVSSILRRSPRSNRKDKHNDQESTSQHIGSDIGHTDCGQPGGIAAACQAEEKVKTPQKHEKNNHERETLNVRRSPRGISRKNAQGDAGECTTDKVADSIANRNIKDSSCLHPVGSACASLKKDCKVVGASSFDFKKEKSEESFKRDQIWAIYSDGDKMPEIYAQIKKVEYTPDFRLHVSVLEPCTPTKGKRTISCGTFKVKKAKSQILLPFAFSHQLKVEPMADNRYEIFPRKGEIWALYKDRNNELTSSNQGRGDCHIVEVLEDTDKSIQVVVLVPVSSSQPFFKAPRIQRSKTGIIEILREDVDRFSHQIPAFQHNGEDDVHLRGCWVLDPSAIPGFVVQID